MKYLIALTTGMALIAASVQAQTPGNIEAAEYDPTGNRWFISNGTSLLETSNGGASYSYFGTASATHGMEVVDGMLIAIGNNVIRVYDLETAESLGTLLISGAGFLNGMGSRTGEVIVSDFSTGRIHRVFIGDPANMSSEVLVSNTGTTPNGVVIDEANNRAVIVNWGSNAPILAVDLDSGELTTLVNGSGIGNLDGIDMDADGSFYVSSWSPARITKFSNDFSLSEIAVQGAGSGLANPADISFAIQTDTLGVANSGNGTPSFHYFGDTSNLMETPEFLESVRWDGQQLTMACPQAGLWSGTAFDMTGKKLHDMELSLPAAPTQVGMERLGWTQDTPSIWTFISPTGTRHSVKPGLRQL
jgi:sugar lactone lactonase YvrE